MGFALTSILSQGERKLPPYRPSGFRSRIRVRGRLFAGMTNSGGTELWLGTVNQHGGFCRAPHRPQRGTSPRTTSLQFPLLWIPAFAGRNVAWYGESAWRILPRLTPAPAGDKPPRYISPLPTPLDSGLRRSELWLGTASRHGGFCHAPPRPQRGTSPRATFPSPTPPLDSGLRWNDEMSGESLSRIGVREVLPCRYEAGPGLESIRPWIRV